jgi:GNAT superfamily N-acetyltransferase
MACSNSDQDVESAQKLLGDDADRRIFDEVLLENPIWNALLTAHRSIAVSADYAEGLARRYPPEIGPLAGIPDQSRESYDALRGLAGPGGLVALFLADPPAPPAGWSLFRGGQLTQMIFRTPLVKPVEPAGEVTLRRLSNGDVPAMMELASLTEPGPFRERTIELGHFYGIFAGDRLLAMAGQRLRVPGFVEVSAVCTHPEARGRGYAGILMREVIRDIVSEGETPFLHAFVDNPAVRLYEKLGFSRRQCLHLAVVKCEG